MPNLLIIDDEPNVLYSLQSGLETDELKVFTAKTARQGLEQAGKVNPDAVIVDVRLPDMSGLDLFDRIKELDPKLPVIVVTAFAATETAIQAMKRGAFEYLLKPVDLHQLREVVEKALALRRMRNVPTVFEGEPEDDQADQIVGQSNAMQEVYKSIGRFASQDVTILILGESGTGKEMVARALYQHSKRQDKPFLAINCAAIPESLLESELFGHEKGSFTGADRQRIGKFEQAHGGTLFLDEIGDMSTTIQAKVLRVLQEQQFERLGGQETVTCDVRVIAATNQKLEEQATTGKFRQDLLYRLNGVTIELPPLRARKDDLPLLIDHFIRQMNVKVEKQVRGIVPDALRVLQDHNWPGNVRELENVIRYGVIQTVSDMITPECLPGTLTGRSAAINTGEVRFGDLRDHVKHLMQAGTPELYRELIHAVDRVILDEVMRHVKNNQVHASELLGMSRTTLRSKLAQIQASEAKQE